MRNSSGSANPWSTIIRYEQDATYPYVGTPDLLFAANGTWWATCNRFDASANQDTSTYIYKSTDNGQTWTLAKTLASCVWGKQFEAGGYIGIIGQTTKYNDLVCYYTDDEWATNGSVTIDGGLWGTGGGSSWLVDNGWLFSVNTYLDNAPPASNGTDNNMRVAFCNLADLTNVANWGLSNSFPWNPALNDVAWSSVTLAEPNIILSGSTFYILPRFICKDGSGNHIRTNANKSPVLTGSFNSGTPSFTISWDESTYATFPGASSNPQFTLGYDETSGKFYSLANYDSIELTTDPNQQRNELWLMASSTISGTFSPVKRLIYGPDYSGSRGYSFDGFQYVCQQKHPTNGGLYYVSRTAFSSDATSEHNGKYMTFHWIPNLSEVLA